jgi:hypothetical protein
VFASFVSFVSFVPCASAQELTQRGFVEGSLFLYPQQAPNDPTQAMGDFLVRDDLFYKPARWIQFAAGLDLRANSDGQVADAWRLDFSDRGVQRPRASIRRLSATLTHGPFTLDVGKQFIRWGKADLINPTDRFAPRDFLNVVDTEFLAVTGVHAVAQTGAETFEAVWVPRFTPSRVPLLDQRWTAVPANTVPLIDAGAVLPSGAQTGLRWGHVGAGFEYSLSFYNGFNYLPNIVATPIVNAGAPAIAVQRVYPQIRSYGADAAMPTRWFTIKGETAYFTSPVAAADLSRQSAAGATADEYVIYVVQLERQSGEWVIAGGYAGEVVTAHRAALTFAPDRGMTQSFIGRASYTIDPNRSVAFETAVRQSGAGVYGKAEYSQGYGLHWRATLGGVVIAGHSDDFLGQYHRNSHVAAALRYSF